MFILDDTETWLDVFKLPRDIWLRELENAQANAIKEQKAAAELAEKQVLFGTRSANFIYHTSVLYFLTTVHSNFSVKQEVNVYTLNQVADL